VADEKLLQMFMEHSGLSRTDAFEELAKRESSRLKEWNDKHSTIQGLDEKWGVDANTGIVYSLQDPSKKVTGDYDLYDIRGANGEVLTDAEIKQVTVELMNNGVAVHEGVTAFGFSNFVPTQKQIENYLRDHPGLSPASAKAALYQKQLY